MAAAAAERNGGGLVEPLGAGQVAEAVGGTNLAAGLGVTVAVDVVAGISDCTGSTRSVGTLVVEGVHATTKLGNAAEADVDFHVYVLARVDDGRIAGYGRCVANAAVVGVLANHVLLVAAGRHIVEEPGCAVATVAAVAIDCCNAPDWCSFYLERAGSSGAVAMAVQI